jgi:hypothetical protein
MFFQDNVVHWKAENKNILLMGYSSMIAGTAGCCGVRGISHHPIHRNLEDSQKSYLGWENGISLKAPSKTFDRSTPRPHLPAPQNSLSAWNTPTGISSGIIQISHRHQRVPSETLHGR